MPNIVPTARYYPKLSEVITVDDLPEFLSFVENGINAIFDKIHYKNLQYSKSVNGDAAFYSLEIVSTELALPLPFDMKLVLNPDPDGNPTISSFPITLEYQWEILAFLKTFNLDNFSFSLEDFYTVGLQVFRITEEEVLAHVMNNFVETDAITTNKFQLVVDEINAVYQLSSNPLVLTPEQESINGLTTAINNHPGINDTVSLVLFTTYILDSENLEQSKIKLQQFFTIVVPEGIENYIKKLIVPKAKATLALSAGIEFPENILRPVTEQGVVIPNIKSTFVFAEAQLYVDTEAGIGYQLEMGGSLNPEFAEIAKTGILLQIESLKLDLSKKTNIPEADADGRPNDFTGVYARAISVTLPSKWFNNYNPETNTSTTLRLGGYDLLIGSGGISGTIALEAVPMIVAGQTFEYYDNKFSFIYPIVIYKKNATTQVVEAITINSYAELKQHIQPIIASNKPIDFRYPLSIQTNGSQVIKKFATAKEYIDYLASLNEIQNGDQIDYSTYLWKKIGSGENGFKIGFHKFDITFKQGTVIGSNIAAMVEIPKFKDASGNAFRIGVKGSFDQDGDFSIAASFPEPDGLKAVLFNVVSFKFMTAEIGKEDDNFFIGTSVKIGFPTGLIHDMLGDQEIIVPKIRVYSNGKFEIVGGNGFLPVNIKIPLGPVDISVTGIHMGSIQREYKGVLRNYNYIGFDGAIKVDPFGIDARGEGLKYYYTNDNDEHGGHGDSFLHIQTIEIDLVVPNSTKLVTIHGMLSVPEPGASQEYAGEVSFKSSKTKLAGSAGMKLAPKFPAFLLDAEVTLPKPIPLGTVAIYGFRGIIGYRYVATKKAIKSLPEDATWYDYYKFPKKGINIRKFAGPYDTTGYDNPFSFGAGAVFGTTADNGKVLALRAMLLLSVPSMFMIEGRGYILKCLPGLDDNSEPPFWAFIAFGENSFEIGMGVDFKLKDASGKVLQLNANAHAFFPINSNKSWFLHVGTKENPNTAIVFKDLINLNASSYLMMASQGIEFGASVSFQLQKNFFGIKVKLYAFISIGAKISFEKPQFGGYLHFGGGIEVNVWRFLYISAELNCYLSGEAVKPFIIFAKLEFRGRIRVFRFLKISFNIRLQLKWEKDNEIDRAIITPLINSSSNPADVTYLKQKSAQGVHMLTNETFDLHFSETEPSVSAITNYIPLDTFIDIKFAKGVNPTLVSGLNSIIGGHTSLAENFTDLIPPQKTVNGNITLNQVTHEYIIKKVEIKARKLDGTGTWQPYNPYAAVDDQVTTFQKHGYWQRSGDQYDTIRIMSDSIYSYLDAGEPGWLIPEQYGITPSNLFCETIIDTWHETDFLNQNVGTIYPISGQLNGYDINGVFFSAIGDFYIEPNYQDELPFNVLKIIDAGNNFYDDFEKSLGFSNKNGLEISFPQDVFAVKLKLTSQAQNVTIKYYRTVPQLVATTAIQYEEIASSVHTYTDLETEISYEIPTIDEYGDPISLEPISKIEIIPSSPDSEAIDAIREQIEALFVNEYSSSDGGVVTVSIPSDMEAYAELTAQLEILLEKECVDDRKPCVKDPVICGLYDQLIALGCFSILPVNVAEVNLNLDCYSQFGQLVSNILKRPSIYADPPYEFTSLYNAYMSELQPNGFSSLAEFNDFYAAAQALLNYTYQIGNCDCDRFSCSTSLQCVTWKTMEEYQTESTLPTQAAIDEEVQAMIASINNRVQPIWRPYTAYYIHIELQDKVDGSITTQPFNYYYSFKTAGPIGHFHNDKGVTYGNEYNPTTNAILNRKDSTGAINPLGKLTNPDKYALTSFRNYIDYDRSYPNADGNLLQFKPLFWGAEECTIDLFFIKPYVYHMFNEWKPIIGLPEIKGSINIVIKDPVTEEIIPYPLPVGVQPLEPQTDPNANHWVDDNDPRLPISIVNLINSINNNANVDANGSSIYNPTSTISCSLALGQPIVPTAKAFSVKLTNLKPQKLYTAIVNNAIDKNGDASFAGFEDTVRNIYENENEQIHQFAFQTSRYQNFESQVNSYILSNENGVQRKAFYDLTIPLTAAQISATYAIVSKMNINVDAGLASIYLDLFDRVMEGVLKMKPIDPPATTEFNFIKNEAGQIIALLIRNPEPFNNPRIPLSEFEVDPISATDANNSEYKVLYSKDYSQVILMNQANLITTEALDITFKYFKWNAGSSQYLPSQTVLVNVTLTTN